MRAPKLLLSSGLITMFGAAVVVLGASCSSEPERDSISQYPPPTAVPEGPRPPGPESLGPGTVDVVLKGTTFAPNGTLSLSNTLVYVTSDLPAPIPSGAYCDSCVTLAPGSFVMSGADGKFELKTKLSTGKSYIVVQKGQFRRVRAVNVKAEGGGEYELDPQLTTLPGHTDKDNGDEAPSMLILYDDFQLDKVDVVLKTLGIDQPTIKMGHGVLKDQAELLKYHVVFVPCGANNDPISASPETKTSLQNYVAAGGKLYVTDWSYEFVRQAFPGYITWENQTPALGSAVANAKWEAPATVDDKGLSDWLHALGHYELTVKGNWTTIKELGTIPALTSKGEPIDIKPKVWVTAKKAGTTPRPATVSFENRCGRVLYSTYHAEGADFGPGGINFTPQEKALLYILFEVDVCTTDITTPK